MVIGHSSIWNYMPILHTTAEQMDFLAMDPNKLRRARQSVMTIDQGQGEGGGQGR